MNDYPLEYQEVCQVIENTTSLYKTVRSRNMPIGHRARDMIFKKKFSNLAWKTNNRLYFHGAKRKRYSEMDAIKNGIGIEFGFRQHAIIESHVFVKIPLFIQAQRINIGIVLMFGTDFSKELPVNTSRFDKVRDRIIASSPLIKYPFAILGISDKPSQLKVDEMTTEIDQYLIRRMGRTLFEMAVQTESNNYDFKQQLPENKKIAQEGCAFANTEGGGLILVGIDKHGVPIGILEGEIDTMKLRISQVIRDNCTPAPKVDFAVFNSYPSPAKSILVVEIDELKQKPCMFENMIYVRDGTSAIPAKPHQVRKMMLGSE